MKTPTQMKAEWLRTNTVTVVPTMVSEVQGRECKAVKPNVSDAVLAVRLHGSVAVTNTTAF